MENIEDYRASLNDVVSQCRYYRGEPANPFDKAVDEKSATFWLAEQFYINGYRKKNISFEEYHYMWVMHSQSVKSEWEESGRQDKLSAVEALTIDQLAITICVVELLDALSAADDTTDWLAEYLKVTNE